MKSILDTSDNLILFQLLLFIFCWITSRYLS